MSVKRSHTLISPLAWLLDTSCLSARSVKTMLLASALVAAVMAATANATPMYRYTYTGSPFAGMQSEPFQAENYVSAEILSPVLLSPGLGNIADMAGVVFSMSNGVHMLQHDPDSGPRYELLPPYVLDHPEIYYDPSVYPDWPYAQVYPTTTIMGGVFISAFDEVGLPEVWSMYIGWSYQSDPRGSDSIGIQSNRYGGLTEDQTTISQSPYGVVSYGLTEGPGRWQLQSIELPEPAPFLLLCVGIAGLISTRAVRRRPLSRCVDSYCFAMSRCADHCGGLKWPILRIP